MKFLRQSCAVLCTLAILQFFAPLPVSAQGGCNFPGCFGGVASFEYICTCSENFLVTFSPYYMYGLPVAEFGDLAFEPGTMTFETYDILPSEGVLGTYVPGVPGCWEYIGYGCIPVEPQNGTILPFTGASYPGGGTL